MTRLLISFSKTVDPGCESHNHAKRIVDWKGCARQRSWSPVRYASYPCVSLEAAKTKDIFSQGKLRATFKGAHLEFKTRSVKLHDLFCSICAIRALTVCRICNNKHPQTVALIIFLANSCGRHSILFSLDIRTNGHRHRLCRKSRRFAV